MNRVVLAACEAQMTIVMNNILAREWYRWCLVQWAERHKN